MPRKKAVVLTDHELRLMNVLWTSGPAAVAEITAALVPPNLAYNTVLSTMRTLEQKGYVTHDETGRAYIYRPLVQRDDAAKSAVNQVLSRFFHSSPNALAMSLLDDVPLRAADRDTIRRLLEPKRKERNDIEHRRRHGRRCGGCLQ